MLRIRFARTGKKKQASYRVVVAEKSRAVQSKFVEILGWYNPHTKELQVDKEKLQVWLSKGASPSDSMAKIFKLNGIELPSWVKIVEKNKEPKKKAKEAAVAPKAEAASEEAIVEADVEVASEASEAKEPSSDKEEAIVEEAISDVSEAEEAVVESSSASDEASNSAKDSQDKSTDKETENKEE